MANTFIAVEGQHDQEFICGLLKSLGFSKVVKVAELNDIFGKRLIDTKFPHGGDLHQRVPNPMFLRRDDDWIAVRAAGGETDKLLPVVRTMLNVLRSYPGSLNSIGIFRDADELPAKDSFDNFCKEFESIKEVEGYEINFPATPGQIGDGNPRVGFFVVPDNVMPGALEELLHECGNVVYPNLIEGAQKFVDSVDLEMLNAKDKRLLLKPHGRKKAVVACAADILKPGMSIATSIHQNRWLCEESQNLPRITAVTAFLKELCGIE